jgi:hypothetical protein
MPSLNKAYLIVVALAFNIVCYGQQLASCNYTTADGLPNNAVRALFMDSEDALWIGTENGVSRFADGTFHSLATQDGLGFNNCWDITQDNKGNMWFASYGGGVTCFNGKKFKVFTTKNGLASNKVRKLFFHDHKMYVGTELGVSIINLATRAITTAKGIEPHFEVFIVTDFFLSDNQVCFSTVNEGFYKIEENVTPKIIPVYRNKHNYSFGVFNDTLYNSNKGFIEKFGINNVALGHIESKKFGYSIVWDYVEDSNKRLYAAAWGVFKPDGGLYRIEGDTMDDISADYGIDSKNLLNVVFDAQKNILYTGSKDKGIYGTRLDNAILYYDFNKLKIIDIENFKQHELLLHQKGLSVLNSNNILKYTLANADFKRFQQNFIETHKNLPTHEIGYFELDYTITSDGIEYYEIVTQDSYFLVSTNIGIFRINAEFKITAYLPIHTYKIGFTPTHKLIETIPYAGVRIYDNKYTLAGKHFSEFDTETPTDIVSVMAMSGKTYMASIFKGLFVHDGKKFTSYAGKGIWKEQKLKFITRNDKNQLIIAAEFGDVYVADDNTKFKIISKISRNSIAGKTITFLEAYKDFIFIGTEQGINIVQGYNVRFLDSEQGFKNRVVTSSKLFRNKLWLGTTAGYYIIDVDKVTGNYPAIKKIKINSISINNIALGKENFTWFYYDKKSLDLDYSQNTIAINFTAVGSLYPKKLQYRYKLKDRERWSPYSTTPYIYLPYLPHGNYNLLVQVWDRHTGLKTTLPLLSVYINPPFWLSWWFIMLAILILLSTIIYLFLRSRNKAREKAAIQKRIAETRHEALVAQMNPHFTFNAMNAIQDFVINNDTDNSLRYISKLAWLMRQTLDNSRQQLIPLKDEIEYLKAYIEIENMRFDNRIEFDLTINSDIDIYTQEIPVMLLQPFIENVFVHAFSEEHPQPRLLLSFSINTDQLLECKIEDNGIGVATNNKPKLHKSKGTQLAIERLELLQPEVDNALTLSQTSEGTIVIILIRN